MSHVAGGHAGARNRHDPRHLDAVRLARLVADLGNARLLTFRGDGHDALTSFNPCIVGAMLGYLEEGALSAPGSACRRDPPF